MGPFEAYLKAYQDLLQKREEAKEKTQSYRSLFQFNQTKLKASLSENLATYQSLIVEFEQSYQDALNALKENFEETLKRSQDHFLDTNETLETELKEASKVKEDVHARTFVKDEDIDTTYQAIYDQANHDQSTSMDAIEKEIESYAYAHQTSQKELEDSTESYKQKLHQDFELIKKTFDTDFKKLSQTAAQTKKEILEKKETLHQTFIKSLKTLEEDYHQAAKPYLEDVGAVRLKHTKIKEQLENTQLQNRAKFERYLNEAKKIDDKEAEKKYKEELSHLKNIHQNELLVIEENLQKDLAPVIEKQKTFQKGYQTQFLTLKKEYLDQLVHLLNQLERTKTEEMLDLDNLNLKLNKDEKTYKASLDLAQMDFTIQSLNYDQRKFEQTLFKEKEKALLGPAFDETILDAKRNLQAHHATEEMSRQEASDFEQFAKKRFDLKRTHAASDKNIKQRYLEAYYAYDKALFKWRLDRQKHQTLIKREAVLNSHYQTFSENYTALSSTWMSPQKEPLKERHQLELEILKKSLETLKQSAKENHQSLLEAIETIYHAEISPLKESYEFEEKIKDKHIQKLEAAFKKQKNTLTIKGDKPLKKNERQLELLTQDHQKALKKLSREFENNVLEIKGLMTRIEEARVNSKEEAETLLNHILDQLDIRFKETKILFDQELRRFEEGETYLEKSSGLFQWFQDKRIDDTTTALAQLDKVRGFKLAEEKTQILEQFLDRLEKIDLQESQAEESYQTALKSLDDQQRQNQKERQSDHQAYLLQNQKEIDEQLRRVENHRQELNEEYESQIKDLSSQMDQARKKFFTEKDRIEKTLDLDIKQLESDYHSYKEKKEAHYNTVIKTHQDQHQALIDALEKDAIVSMQSKDISFIEGILEKTVPMNTLIEAL